MKRFRIFSVLFLAGSLLFGVAASVLAAGSDYNFGDGYSNGVVTFYTNARYVTDYTQPGPEVVNYLQTSSASGYLMLGTSRCGTTYDGPIYTQYLNAYNPVAYFSTNRKFCIVTYGNGRSGSFDGNLFWD